MLTNTNKSLMYNIGIYRMVYIGIILEAGGSPMGERCFSVEKSLFQNDLNLRYVNKYVL